MAALEASILRLTAVRATRGSNVILHPVTRILIAISSIFLLSKLENGTAYARTAVNEHGGTAADGARKYDSGLIHRAAATVQRLYELVDTPAVVAAVASVLVTIEIAKNAPPSEGDVPWGSHENAATGPAIAPETARTDAPADPGQHASGHVQESALVIDPQHQLLVVAHPAEVNLSPAMVEWQPPQVWLEAENGAPAGGSGPAVAPDAPASVGSASPKAEVSVGAASAQKAEDHPQQDAKPDPIAFEAVQEALAQIAGDADTLVAATIHEGDELVTQPAAETMADAADADAPVGEISPADLAGLSQRVGFLYESSSDGKTLLDALADLIEHFGAVDIEYGANDVVIEQTNIEDAPAHSVGMWVNLMSDGSRISVIGSSEIVDDILGAGLTPTS